ncbi:MAG: riboflavin synthase [Proteobacteria bacterium]|nr:riboflavin synthase [Pseudomonadota bacterium]
MWYTDAVFTGLVEDAGTITRVDRQGDAIVFAVRPAGIPIAELVVGESVCHDGTCLTVTSIIPASPESPGTYTVLAGAETLGRTTLGRLAVGARVNLERALRLGDRLGGHWVTGHVDGVGELVSKAPIAGGANLVLAIRPPAALLRYIVEKGSIAVAGVSLTVNAVDAATFSIALIPHTLDATTLGEVAVGGTFNLEVDILAKHVEKLLGGKS